MPSAKLLHEIDHFIEVRRLMTEAGFTHPGADLAALTREELREQSLGAASGVSAADVAEQFIARRRLAMGSATVALETQVQCVHVAEYGDHAWTNDTPDGSRSHCVECGVMHEGSPGAATTVAA